MARQQTAEKAEPRESFPSALPEHPWAMGVKELSSHLHVDLQTGLAHTEAQERQKRFGSNTLRRINRRSVVRILLSQFRSVIAGLLFAAAVLAFGFGQNVEGSAILAVLIINGIIGFLMEWRATRAMEALRKLSRTKATVQREGQTQSIRAEQLAPGDLVVIESGQLIAADIRLVESNRLAADESALTGESRTVDKDVGAVAEDAAPDARHCMLHKGTAVTRGSGRGIVVATGMDTELGRIANLVESAEEETVPLQRRMDRLGRRLVWITLLIAAAVAGLGVAAGRDLFLIVESAIALAVATVPEGLPIVATLALARGVWRMADRNALVNRLAAVETLGSTTLILTDKTGTLTENRMRVVRFLLVDHDVRVDENGDDISFHIEGDAVDPGETKLLKRALETGVLCNNASLPSPDAEEEEAVGDPMEAALLQAGRWGGIERDALLETYPEEREVAFDPDRKMMATFHQAPDGAYRVAVKGAPDAVLDACNRKAGSQSAVSFAEEEKEAWRDKNRNLASDGLRVLALAWRQTESLDDEPYTELIFLGLCGLHDPPRTAVQSAIDTCQAAGIHVVMTTGDQKETALRVGRAVGIVDEAHPRIGHVSEDIDKLDAAEKEQLCASRILPRATPKNKMDLLALHQERGEIVAMLGDGINDAPALKKANVGVAMGRRGTQVAKEAADVVLRDDAFGTIVTAIRWGRVIFGNIRRFLIYLMSIHLGEILVVGLAALLGTPLPILPLQILYLNLVT
ncbi:MAG: cation-translocating P-type ATPase, partial [Verrucomicrobiota bacterium]